MAKWTEERKKRQAEAIKRWKPWEKSTGPKTDKGKARCSLNAIKSGAYTGQIREMREMLRHNKEFLEHFINMHVAEHELICKRNGLLKVLEKSNRCKEQNISGKRTIRKLKNDLRRKNPEKAHLRDHRPPGCR